MRTNRGSLRFEHLSDLSKCLVPIDPPGLEFYGNGSILLWPIARTRHANVGSTSRDEFTLDLDITERRSRFSSQQGVYIGLLGRWIGTFGEEMVPYLVGKRARDSGALPNRILVNDDLLTGNKIGAHTGLPPDNIQIVALSLCEARPKCWGFRQKWRQRGVSQRGCRTTYGAWASTLLRLWQYRVFSTFHAGALAHGVNAD